MTKFEFFATNHDKHDHCAGCGSCMLDPRIKQLGITPIWCVSCFKRIESKLHPEAKRPWDGGMVFIR